jgi:uncharacterized protein (TIGR03083 family)
MSATDSPTLGLPVRPGPDHDTAMRLAATEYDRFAEALAGLDESDWSRPTDCPDWDVRQLACHTIGMAAMGSSPVETVRQQVKAMRRARADRVDALTALTSVQVDERTDWSPERVVAEARLVGPRAVRGRRRTPGFVRSRTLPQKQSVGGVAERWTIGFLNDVILTRDVWMHRMDVARATGREPVLTRDHDGAIVDDVVAEWAARHGAAYHLTLTGPLGGTWSPRPGGEVIELDAVDFCRILSGRVDGHDKDNDRGLMGIAVPF